LTHSVGLFFLRSNGLEEALRRTIINNLEQETETAAELQRTDRITTVLVGTGSPLAQVGPQTRALMQASGLAETALEAGAELHFPKEAGWDLTNRDGF
jgi:hypothetical protein